MWAKTLTFYRSKGLILIIIVSLLIDKKKNGTMDKDLKSKYQHVN